MSVDDPQPGDRVSLFKLARSTEFDKIGRVDHVNKAERYANVKLEPQYSGLERSVAYMYKTYFEDDDTVTVLRVPFDDMDVIQPPDVVLTPSQLVACLIGPWAMGYGLETRGVALTRNSRSQSAGADWVLVENAEDQGIEGSGVLMDPNGGVHYSGGFPDAKPTKIMFRRVGPGSHGEEIVAGLFGLPLNLSELGLKRTVLITVIDDAPSGETPDEGPVEVV